MRQGIDRMTWRIGVAAILLGVCSTFAGCGQNDPATGTSCTADEDCPEGKFCSDSDICTQTCNPLKGVDACGEGMVCTTRGRCVPGECQTAEQCDDPPPPQCTDGDLMVADDRGDCVRTDDTLTCEYDRTPTNCEYGCESQSCNQSPCATKTCNQPPTAECSEDGQDRITFESPGTCDDATGDCSYDRVRTPCPFGCDGGTCNDGACDAVTCDDPPSAECSGDVRITYDSNGTCREQGDEAVCDYPRNFENCRYAGAECSGGSCMGAVTQTGEVVVTEFMADPEATEDYNGEWIELLNTTGSSLNLQNWQLQSQGDDGHTIQDSLTVDPDSRVVLALSSDPAGNGDVTPDYVYSDFQLGNGEDTIRIVDPDGVISDHVYYEPGAIMDGLSRMLDPTVTPTATSNDDFSNWCPALADSDTFGVDGRDRGTPGAANSSCSQMPCADWTCRKPEGFCQDGTATRPTRDTATCEESRFNNPACDFNVQSFQCSSQELCSAGQCYSIPSDKPAAGELMITEMMGNPSGVSDSDGEWIEIHNPTGRDIPLFSLILEDNESGGAHDAYTFKDPQATVPAGGYIVVVRNTDSSENGGISGGINFDGWHLKNSPGSNMAIKLVRQDGTEIDSARYLDPTSGASQQLDRSTYTSSSNPAQTNDGSANWCDGTMSYGAGGSGTPGNQNVDCP